MRFRPHGSRLRAVALGCWTIAAFCLIQSNFVSLSAPQLLALTISTRLLGILLLALGVAFWLLGTDRRAGIMFDSKGLVLNLGSSTSFIAWENIERVGVSSYRSNLLAIGSKHQFGIRLRDTSVYMQSYEERLPAATGVFATALRCLSWLLQRFQYSNDRPLAARLAHNRVKSDFDILIPEAFVGGRADSFAELVEACRVNMVARRRNILAPKR